MKAAVDRPRDGIVARPRGNPGNVSGWRRGPIVRITLSGGDSFANGESSWRRGQNAVPQGPKPGEMDRIRAVPAVGWLLFNFLVLFEVMRTALVSTEG